MTKDINKALMKEIAERLVFLSNESGTNDSGNKKVMIPQSRDEAMDFIKRLSYKRKGTFSIDNPDVVEEARRLVQKHSQVWVVPNTKTLKYELYIPPDRDKTTYSASSSETASKSGGCFIATAVYGSDSTPEVLVLRTFKDTVLLPSRIGEIFVNTYYLVSPPLARVIASKPFIRKIVRKVLIQPIVKLCRSWMNRNLGGINK